MASVQRERRKPALESLESIGTSSYKGVASKEKSSFALPAEDILPAGVERKGPHQLEEHISRPVPHRGWKYDYRKHQHRQKDPLEDSGRFFPSGTFRCYQGSAFLLLRLVVVLIVSPRSTAKVPVLDVR